MVELQNASPLPFVVVMLMLFMAYHFFMMCVWNKIIALFLAFSHIDYKWIMWGILLPMLKDST